MDRSREIIKKIKTTIYTRSRICQVGSLRPKIYAYILTSAFTKSPRATVVQARRRLPPSTHTAPLSFLGSYSWKLKVLPKAHRRILTAESDQAFKNDWLLSAQKITAIDTLFHTYLDWKSDLKESQSKAQSSLSEQSEYV